MGFFQDNYHETVLEIGHHAITDFIVSKFEEHGVVVTEGDRQLILDNIINGIVEFSISVDSEQDDNIEITITAKEENELIKKIDSILKDLLASDSLISLAKTISVECTRELKKHWDKHEELENKSTNTFRKELCTIWGEPIKYLRMMKTVFAQSCETVINDMSIAIKEGKQKDSASLRVSYLFGARAVQILGEIITLIRAGFAEAAFSRWRTLYEIHVIASFIMQNGDKVAERYLDHDVIESYRASNDYQDCFEKLGCEPIPEEEIISTEKAMEEMIIRYGNAFKTQYGWAAEALGVKNPSFRTIETATDLNHFKAHYRLASHGVHANPKGFLFRISQPCYTDSLIAGPSLYGLSGPISWTSVTALQLFATLSSKWASFDSIIAVKALENLVTDISNELDKIKINIETTPSNQI